MRNYQSFQSLDNLNICINGFTFRNGGVAELPFGDQHMGLLSFHYQDEAWLNILHLIKQVEPANGLRAVVATEQIHQDHLEKYSLDFSKGEVKDGYRLQVLSNTDGVFTDERNVLLLTFYADCTPVYFLDPINGVVGMVHSGWKGTALKIAVSGLRFMLEKFNSSLSDVRIVIGPSASVCCYEVDQTVYDHFPTQAHCFKPSREGHYYMNMKQIIAENLMEAGLTSAQIEISPDCTLCQENLYFSHRREAGNTGRMAAFMMLKD